MKLIRLALAAALFATIAVPASAQTFKTDYSTQLILAGGGTNTINTVTLNALAPATPITFTLPNVYPNAAGYVLVSTTTGGLSWANPAATSLNLTTNHFFVGNASGVGTDVPMYGDVSLTYNATNGGVTAITTAAGNDIVGALNNVATTIAIDNTAVSITAGAITGSSLTTTGAAQIGTGASTTNDFGTGESDGNTIGNGTAGNLSTTTINGNLDITGAVTYTTAPTTPLATNDIFIGNATSGGQAEAVGMTGDATIAFTTGPDAATLTLATVNATTGSFGDASDVSTFTVNGKGLVTLSGSTPIQIAESQVTRLTGDLTSATTTAENYFSAGTGISLSSGLIANTGVLSVAGTGPVNSTGGATPSISLTTGSLTSTSSSINVTGTGNTVGANINADLNMSNTNTWTVAQNFNGGIASTGSNNLALTSPASQTINLNSGNANGINIGVGPSEANTIDIGNGTAPLSGSYSTTNLAGAVTFTGTVTLPNGSVSAASIPLADGDILVGNSASPNVAAPVALSQDVTISDAGVATVQGSHAATTFAVVNAETVGGSLGVTGQTTIGSAQLSASANVDVTAGGAIAIGNAHSYVPLTTTGTQTAPITSFTGENMGAGQILTFSNVGANNITLHSTAGTFSLNGGDVIMGPGGTATLLSTGTNWILLSSQ